MTRPDKHDFDTLTDNSWSVHGGNHADETTGAIRTPIVMANSYRLPDDPSAIDDPGYQDLVYTREHGANQLGLQEKLAKLDHGEAAAVFGTGMAALHATFFTILNPGDHAIVSNVVYMRVSGLFTDVFPKKLGIEVDFVDITDLDAVRAAVRPNTRLIHTEVIANPDLRVADIAALAQIAHDNGALLTVDSTFTPPPMMRPLDHGADLVIHSLTKYINGHGDAMGGVVIGSRDLVEETRIGAMQHVGGAISPFNAWLIMRGSITLPLRLQRQCENAHAVADFLAATHASPTSPTRACPATPTTTLPPPSSPAASAASSPSPSPAHTGSTDVRQRPAPHHLRGIPRPRRDAHRLRGVPRRPRSRVRAAVPRPRPRPARHRPRSGRRPHRRPRRVTHHRLRERRSPRRGSGPLAWGFGLSRLSESNRRPIHYE